MHLAVGLNLFSTMIQTAVFYFGKRTLGYERGHGDFIRRAQLFLRATAGLRVGFTNPRRIPAAGSP